MENELKIRRALNTGIHNLE